MVHAIDVSLVRFVLGPGLPPREGWVGTSPKLIPKSRVTPFTPKSDQFQISHAASQEMLQDRVWRT